MPIVYFLPHTWTLIYPPFIRSYHIISYIPYPNLSKIRWDFSRKRRTTLPSLNRPCDKVLIRLSLPPPPRQTRTPMRPPSTRSMLIPRPRTYLTLRHSTMLSLLPLSNSHSQTPTRSSSPRLGQQKRSVHVKNGRGGREVQGVERYGQAASLGCNHNLSIRGGGGTGLVNRAELISGASQ